MLLDLGPLKRHRNFRLVFAGQLISLLGSMLSYVAVPVQIQTLTQSPLMVGLLGVTQLLPVLFFGLWGGSLADALDRRRLLVYSEAVMTLCSLGLALNAAAPHPSVIAVFMLVFVMQSANSLHRPAMEALAQKLVTVPELPAASALISLRGSVGSVAGPMIGGVLVTIGGVSAAYVVDALSFGVAMTCLALLRDLPPREQTARAGWDSILEGLRYALKRPELLGTYIVDIVAMAFAFPVALFPSMAEGWGGAGATGYLFSAMPAGAVLVSAFSGWTGKIQRQGAAVVVAAAAWGVFVIGFGYAKTLPWALVFLVLAGAADAVSGIFRMTIWNQTIPNHLRGRLAGVEMISYLTGPLLGNTRAGAVASAAGNMVSIVSGGAVCVVGVMTCALFLPKLLQYQKPILSNQDKADNAGA